MSKPITLSEVKHMLGESKDIIEQFSIVVALGLLITFNYFSRNKVKENGTN